MITKSFFQFINEELRMDKMDVDSLIQLKENLLHRLGEYREYILSNIEYNIKTNKIEYKKFETVDIDVIMRELINEFSKEVTDELNIESFLRKVNQTLELKKRNTKKKIRKEFDDYFESIDQRIEKRQTGEPDEINPIEGEGSIISRKQYESEKYQIQIELLKLQEWVVKNKKRVAIIFEGRDAAGKGSTIKRFTEYLNPKEFKVVALGTPTEEEKENWLERYERHLPKDGKIVFFDRSWYNRGVVEPALGYCTEEQYTDFMEEVIDWEENL